MNPLLETAGLIAAILICVFILVLILLTVVFNVGMAFGMSWLAEKIQVIKMLRPTVESVNKATESALEGIPPDENQSAAIRTAASIPATMRNLERNIDRRTDKVADAVIEFHARTVQVKTVLKAFVLPGSMHKKQEKSLDETGLEFGSPGYRMLAEERPEAIPIESPPDDRQSEQIPPTEQVQHATIR
jgi:hypothetical protein